MLRNYLAAALRNLVRNRLYALINIAGLAVAIAAVLLIALFVRDELTHDSWIPGHERTYLLTSTDGGSMNFDIFPADLPPKLKLDFPAVESVARMVPAQVSLRRGAVEANEQIFWADPELFDVLPFPVLAGDPRSALARPEGMVVTRAIARKYFGRDDAVGGVLEVNRGHPMTVMAVIADLPPNTELSATVLASALSPLAPFYGPTPDYDSIGAYAYARLKAGASVADFQAALPDFMTRHRGKPMTLPNGREIRPVPVPLTRVHLNKLPSYNAFAMKPRGSWAAIAGVTAIGGLILLVACINFVNLMTAWAGRRAAEVGVRKVSGAERRDLIVQFIGESLLYVFFSAVLAVILAQRLSPALQAFLGRDAPFQYWREPVFILGIVGFVLVLGALAGAYPALVLSAFKPARVLKTNLIHASGSGRLRRLLAMLQFAVLIGLIAATGTIYSQIHFALNEGMRLKTDQTILIATACQGAFKDAVRALPGVKGAACSHAHALDRGGRINDLDLPDGTRTLITQTAIGPGFLEMYGLRPLAGRFLAESRGDEISGAGQPPSKVAVVINETAAQKFGFAAPEMAIGRALPFNPRRRIDAEVIGVVPDFSLDAVGTVIAPTFYFADASSYGSLNVRLSGQDIPETLAAINRLWDALGEPRPITLTFVDQWLEDLYRNITRQGEVFAVFAGVAVFIACLGLFGLAAFTAERRTKEIGVRKAMGASTRDILGLLVWEFTKPVLWANAIAWPAGYMAMRYWLETFAYHVDLQPWVFLAASVVALMIAAATVLGHAALVARAEPVKALRYE